MLGCRTAPERAIAAILVTAVALTFAGCGGGGGTPTTESDKVADTQILNYVLSRELTAIDAYTRGLPTLRGRMLAAGRQFRSQEQEHVDAIIKAIRGLGGKTDAEAAPFDAPAPKTQAGALAFVYGVESSTIRNHIAEIVKLTTTWPRSLLTSIVANEAQQLVVLRGGLGATPLGAVPEAFEPGNIPPPGTG
jgi:Ferritin-like domain